MPTPASAWQSSQGRIARASSPIAESTPPCWISAPGRPRAAADRARLAARRSTPRPRLRWAASSARATGAILSLWRRAGGEVGELLLEIEPRLARRAAARPPQACPGPARHGTSRRRGPARARRPGRSAGRARSRGGRRRGLAREPEREADQQQGGPCSLALGGEGSAWAGFMLIPAAARRGRGGWWSARRCRRACRGSRPGRRRRGRRGQLSP